MKSLAVYYSEGPQLSSLARSDSKGHVILHHMLLLSASLQSFPLDRTVKAVIINREFALMKYAVFSYEAPEESMFPFCLRVFLGIFS